VSLPLQGGLEPVDGLVGDVVEIACDESGFSGTNLLDAASPVITHASVDLCTDEAAELITGLRSGSRYSLHEFKAGQLLRDSGAEGARDRFLTALSGRAHVHLVDKEYFLVTRVVDLFLAEPSYAAGTRLTQEQRAAALVLHRAGRVAGRDWRSSTWSGPNGATCRTSARWSGSSGPATRWRLTASARRPRECSTGSTGSGWVPC
jgi:hypothetical protein